MSIRCPCYQEEYAGSDHCIVCRRYIARQMKYTCPFSRNQWKPRDGCKKLDRVLRKPDRSHYTIDELRETLFPEGNAISGSGEPVNKVDQIIREVET